METTQFILCGIIIALTGYIFILLLRQRRQNHDKERRQALSLSVSSNDVMQYIRDTAENFNPLMQSSHINFHVKCTPESMMGWIDTSKIDKVILLLLSDMRRNAGENGKVTIDAYTNDSYDQVVVRFNDNGGRIELTDYFIVYQMINIHHGTITHHYYEGQGNSITIVLPIKKDAYAKELTNHIQSTPFHIPQNIELNVPTIDIPTAAANSETPLGAIIQQAYASADQQYLQRAVKVLSDHITDSDYDREAFASDMGCSVSTLYNKIKALTGKSITNFARDIRIKTACRLAREHPELRVSDLAYQVGFKDPKYFATSFKRVMGVQPKEYIAQLKSASH